MNFLFESFVKRWWRSKISASSVQDFFEKLLLNGINKLLEDRSEKYAFKNMLVFLKYLVSTVKLESSKSVKMS